MTIVWSDEIGFSATGTLQLPDEDGIYVIAEITNGITEVRYVGQGNIRNQIALHMSDIEPNSCLKAVMSNTSNVKMKFTSISNGTERDNVESTFYQHYKIKGHNLCNRISPPSGVWLGGIMLPF